MVVKKLNFGKFALCISNCVIAMRRFNNDLMTPLSFHGTRRVATNVIKIDNGLLMYIFYIGEQIFDIFTLHLKIQLQPSLFLCSVNACDQSI